MLIRTYGAYEHIVRAAVLSDEPVFSYNHKVRANAVIPLPRWDTLWVLQRIKKSFSSFPLFFISLLLFASIFLKTEAKSEDISLALFLHAVSSDSAWSYYNAKFHFFFFLSIHKFDFILTQSENFYILGLGHPKRKTKNLLSC